MSVSDTRDKPHLVFLPSGIGSLIPFFRLAVKMASYNCRVTFINLQPHPIDLYFANQQGVEVLEFEMLVDTSSPTITDPFIGRVAATNRALDQVKPTLYTLQASVIFSDFSVAATLARISDDLNVPIFVVSTTSAMFLAVIRAIPFLLSQDPDVFSGSSGEIEVQGMPLIQKANIPAAWLHKSSTNNLLTSYLLPNARALPKVGGVFLNTFNWFEQETLASLNTSKPPFFPVGPLPAYEKRKGHHLPWLSEQPAESVVYVNFGSREVISADQTRELRKGLEICGYHYLWVMTNCALDGYAGESCCGRRDKGVIVRGGVDQESVLADPSIGVFVNQCEWESIMQAAWEGVTMLAWPQHGDQKMNAEAVEKSGLGIWMKEWSCKVEDVVDGDEIGRAVKQVMEDLNIKKAAKVVRERAREASENDGSSQKAIEKFMQMVTTYKQQEQG